MQSTTDGQSEAQRARCGAALAAYMRDAPAMERAHRLIQRRAGPHRDSYVARELVTDVIEDMFGGVLPFDPELPVAEQVETCVKRRAAGLRTADRRPRSKGRTQSAPRGPRRMTLVPLDEAPSSALTVDGPDEVLVEPAVMVDPVEWVRRTRTLAVGDEPVGQLLALFDRRLYLRRDALEHGMTEWSYRTARTRLRDYASNARQAILAEAVAAQLAA